MRRRRNAKRCEICGKLYDVVHGHVDVSLYNDAKVHSDDGYYEGTRYNVCEACARKILEIIDILMNGE